MEKRESIENALIKPEARGVERLPCTDGQDTGQGLKEKIIDRGHLMSTAADVGLTPTTNGQRFGGGEREGARGTNDA